ncbi:MAG: hypothetical protein JXB48_19160 [Candidatus Latescibacteria bacterium]|nr:hypothetical protein [Candidatus Latescibacterota bacterium]
MKKHAVWSLIAGFAIMILAFVLRSEGLISVFLNIALLYAGLIAIGFSVHPSNLPQGGRYKRLGVWVLFAGLLIMILAFALPGLPVSSRHALMNVAFWVIAYSVYLSNLPRDERSRRLGAKSLAWSWLATFVTLGTLMWYHQYRPGYLTVERVLIILYFTMLVSAAIFYRWLKHWGTVE